MRARAPRRAWRAPFASTPRTAPFVTARGQIHHGETLALRDNADGAQKATHVVVRLLGVLLLASGWQTWAARASPDAYARRALIQAHWAVLTLSALVLLRAQLTPGGGMAASNWITIAVLVGLACSYAWLAFFERIKVFELGRVEL